MSSAPSFVSLTDVGRKREENEDNFLVDESIGLFVVCDGMGGHAAGEVASALAVRTFHEEVKRDAELLTDYAAGKKGVERVSKRDITNMLEFAVNRASARVHAEASKDEKRRGMGTTLVAIVICGQTGFIVYVGDSRLYLQRDGSVQQVTEDHNVFNELIKRKKMPREKVEKLAQKNAITRAVGVYEHAEPDTIVLDLIANDRILLCSDGLYQYFEEDLEDLAKRMGASDMKAAMHQFIDDANERGGSDNITGVLLNVGGTADQDEDRARRLQLKRDLLAKMRLFRPLNERELLRVLQVTEVIPYADGATVMKQGSGGEELFIVLEGKVEVLRGDSVIATLEQGAHVGEMALVRNQPRSATVRSQGRSELMVIRRRDFFELLRNEHSLAVKLLWQFLGVVADRLADTSRELGQVREELEAEDLTEELFEEIDPEDYGLGRDSYADDEELDRPTLVVPAPVNSDEVSVINESVPAAKPTEDN
jgi:serine/threonine protein phosphatase PrpC/CRP-like cAMP-binding protein